MKHVSLKVEEDPDRGQEAFLDFGSDGSGVRRVVYEVFLKQRVNCTLDTLSPIQQEINAIGEMLARMLLIRTINERVELQVAVADRLSQLAARSDVHGVYRASIEAIEKEFEDLCRLGENDFVNK